MLVLYLIMAESRSYYTNVLLFKEVSNEPQTEALTNAGRRILPRS